MPPPPPLVVLMVGVVDATSPSHLRVCEGLADGVVNFGPLATTALPSRNVDQAQPVAGPRGFRCVTERLLIELRVTSADGDRLGRAGAG